MNKKKIMIFVILMIGIISIVGGTLAYLTWTTGDEDKTNIVFTYNSDFQCAVNGGGNITSSDVVLVPSSCNNENHAIKREVIVTPTIYETNMEVAMNLWMNIESIDSGLSNTQYFRYALTTNPNSCTSDVVSSGNFNNRTAGDQITILNKTYTGTTAETYYLYVWLDKDETDVGTSGQSFNISLGGICEGEITNSVIISGTPTVGATLVAAVSNVDETQTYTYQWYSSDTAVTSGGTPLEGATSSTYVVAPEVAGKYIYVVVTSSDGKTISEVTSTATQEDTGIPTVTIGSLSGTTVALNYSDSIGVTKYYFGTSDPSTTTVTWTDIESTTSGNVDKTVSTAGKYYFAAQDASGNIASSSFDLSVGTFYYYNGSAQTSTVDRCIIYSGSSSCNYSLPSAISSSTGPNSATYYGVSTSTSSNTVTTSYTSANSNYYAVYKGSWTATYTIGTGVSTIGATSNSCTNYKRTNGTTYSSTSCSVTLPAITANSGYSVLGWYNSSDTKVGDAGGSLSLSANGTYTAKAELAAYSEPILNGAAPILSTGMIPITIGSGGVATTVDPLDSSWYSYENKEWANVVLVNSSSRSSYYESDGVTIKPNIEIPEDNILAYYVWIPKYSYKMNGHQQSISISFNSTPSGYRSHPAFTFDGDNQGFWVGKFETGHSSSSINTYTENALNCTNESCTLADGLIVKPEIYPRVLEKIANKFYVTRSMERNGNAFGLVSSEVDTHMMKNSEWGAVAYLSRSVYGIDKQIRLNNYDAGINYEYMTGCGAYETNGESVSYCEISYYWGDESDDADPNSLYPQSTTGNITGIFDMAGGAHETVMGYYTGANSNYSSNPSNYFGWTSSANAAGFTSLIDSKYWDQYTKGGQGYVETACNGSICYGHALSELFNSNDLTWYNDAKTWVTSDYPWVSRGGSASSAESAGIFAFNSYGGGSGSSSDGSSWRTVIFSFNN